MENNRTVLLCDNDYASSNEIQAILEQKGYDVDTIDKASDLIPTVIRFHPNVIIVNPDMEGFNESDVCKHIMQDLEIPIILLVDAHSTARARVGDCLAEDVVTRPVHAGNLANLVAKH